MKDFQINFTPTIVTGASWDHIYIAIGLWTRRVKIGRAKIPHQRFAQLCAMSGEELFLLGWAGGLGHCETLVHKEWQAHRHHGGWFSPVATEVITRHVPIRSEFERLYRSTDALSEYVQVIYDRRE